MQWQRFNLRKSKGGFQVSNIRRIEQFRNAILAYCFILLSGTCSTFAQTKKIPTREENLGLEYAVQYSEMTKYMAYIVGTEDDQEGNRVAIFEFEAI